MEAQLEARRRAEELHGYMADLLGWQKEMKAKEAKAKQQAAAGAALQPARSPMAAAAVNQAPPSPAVSAPAPSRLSSGGDGGEQPAPRAKHPAAHTYEHYRDRWERFDADAALAEADGGSKPAQGPTAAGTGGQQRHGGTAAIPARRSAAVRPAAAAAAPPPAAGAGGAAPTTAEGWREQGNAHFRRGEHEHAVECYSRSASLDPGCHLALANRAMALLRLGRPAEAEADCGAALARAPGYVKAWQRRRGKWLAAAEDFEQVVRLDPGNKAAAADRRECIACLAAAEGVRLPPPAERLPVTLAAPPPAAAGEELMREVRSSHRPQGAQGAEHWGAPLAAVQAAPAPAGAGGGVAVEVDGAAQLGDDDEALPPLPGTEAAPAPATAAGGTGQPPAAGAGQLPGAAAAAPPPAAQPPAGERAVPPAAGVEFERAWRSLRGDPARQAQYLLLLPPSQLPAVLRQALTPPLLADALRALLGLLAAPPGGTEGADGADAGTRVQHHAAAVALLEGLPAVPRFDVNLLSLPPRDKAAIAAAWDAAACGAAAADAAAGAAGPAGALSERLVALRARYKLPVLFRRARPRREAASASHGPPPTSLPWDGASGAERSARLAQLAALLAAAHSATDSVLRAQELEAMAEASRVELLIAELGNMQGFAGAACLSFVVRPPSLPPPTCSPARFAQRLLAVLPFLSPAALPPPLVPALAGADAAALAARVVALRAALPCGADLGALLATRPAWLLEDGPGGGFAEVEESMATLAPFFSGEELRQWAAADPDGLLAARRAWARVQAARGPCAALWLPAAVRQVLPAPPAGRTRAGAFGGHSRRALRDGLSNGST
eukprot:scaffold28.g7556.t1